MPDSSPRLELPYLLPSQAQKHVTHNEALARLDTLVQLTVQALDAESPPAEPQAGQVFGLGPAPVSDWAGQEGRLAVWDGVAWGFVSPAEGWRAFDLTAGRLMAFSGGAWVPVAPAPQDLAGVGIGTTSDPVNRLAVAADATLFTHDGSDHRLKINKAAAGDTASLLFQSGWTGHAEIGLAGDTALSVKVSADGQSWTEAMRADPAAQSLSWAPGSTVRMALTDSALQLDVPVTGTAAQSSATDTTADRLMKVGAFGLGRPGYGVGLTDCDDYALPTGFYYVNGAATANKPSGVSYGVMYVSRMSTTTTGQILLSGTKFMVRYCAGGTWGSWRNVYDTANIVGTVSQSGGVPTGALIERGSNANGEYVRFADGTQIAWHRPQLVYTSTSQMSLTWTYPASFTPAPNIVATLDLTGMSITPVYPDLGAVGINTYAGSALIKIARITGMTNFTAPDTLYLRCSAVGRWF